MKIALVGPYPPPYGGISIHVQRLSERMRQAGQEVVVFKNMTIRKWLLVNFGRWHRYDVIHFHDIHWLDRFFIGVLSLTGVKTILTIHGDSFRDQIQLLQSLPRKLLIWGVRQTGHVVAVKPEIRQALISVGIDPGKISVITAYLPPAVHSSDVSRLPEKIKTFLVQHDPLLLMNAFDIIPYQGDDLYGIRLSLETCRLLIHKYPQLGCLCFLAQVSQQEKYQQFQAQIGDMGLKDHYEFIIDQPLTAALSTANVFLRPTYRDGFSVSLAEAIDLDVPSIASDVCLRPNGVKLFPAGDIEALTRCVQEVLAEKRQKVQERPPDTSTLTQLMEVYTRLTGSRKVADISE